MKAEDTVMDARIASVLEEECGIKFPAEYYDAIDPEDFRRVFRAGIKEVVEWTQNNGFIPLEHNRSIAYLAHDNRVYCLPGCRLCKWQAKLKEWGINETHKR